MANHLVIKDKQLNGWEYGMLRSFERAIEEETGAQTVELPQYNINNKYMSHFGHGMKRGVYRKYFPKQPLALKADVAWSILMGPENYRLDLFKGWQYGCRKKVLYIYDTMPFQYPVIQRLFSNDNWDLLITSFNDAAADLEQLTGRKWHSLEQAADRNLFTPVPLQERLIHFSSYGRRYPALHEAIKDFCAARGLYYDYTTHDAKHPTADAKDLYQQYAWHLSHSVFTLSWPVELTNPARAGHLHPITCRWFEAAAAGTVILGKRPANEAFDELLGNQLVVEIDPFASKEVLQEQIEHIWNNRENLHNRAALVREQRLAKLSWNERVNRILSWI
ncbi:MAG TPA: glycosyltransferase [Chitinophagaceae bacterium]|nr:glycosyltransferase [Chitinophagaceae bacterium]